MATLKDENGKPENQSENQQKPKNKNFTEEVGNISFDMIFVKGGTFAMGSPDNDKDFGDNEKPQHKVRLNDYYIGKNAVTFAEYDIFSQLLPTCYRQHICRLSSGASLI